MNTTLPRPSIVARLNAVIAAAAVTLGTLTALDAAASNEANAALLACQAPAAKPV